jgi:hypothetical protein
MSITFSTAWYVFKAKFDPVVYYDWIHKMLSNVHCYYLVVYTDNSGINFLKKYENNPRIKIIIKPYTNFYTYKYKNEWIHNHENNLLLKERVDWKLNMLWSEKIHFVKETIQKKYFDTEYFGWCDIGYFRGRPMDLPFDLLSNWPNENKIKSLNKNKIYYACINNNIDYLSQLVNLINNKNDKGLPIIDIPPNQLSVAGGFFISHVSKLQWWHSTFYAKLENYFINDYLVKDDQIIVADCVFSDIDNFEIIFENDNKYDNWFLFQRYLL